MPESGQTDLARVTAMDLNLLVPLLAVLEERSVTRAAERVGLSQPAMSHALGRIRRLLGDQVLVRHGHESTLTPRALALLGPLRRIIEQTAALVAPSDFDPETDARTITLAMSTSTALVAGPDLCQVIAERAPHTTLRILVTADTSDAVFTHERADVLLLSEAFSTPHDRERLYDDRWVVVSGQPFLPGETTVEALRGRPHVVHDGPELRRPYQVLLEERLPYTVRERCTHNLLLPVLVAGRDRVAVERHSVAARLRGAHELYLAEFPFPVPCLGIDMVWNPWLPDRSFREWLRQTLLDAVAPWTFMAHM